MSVRVRYKIQVAVSSTSAEDKDLGNLSWEIVTDQQGEGGSWKTVVAAGAVDVQIPMDSIADVRLLILRTTAKDPNQTPNQILIRRNTNVAEQIEILPLADAKEGHLLLSTDGLTAIYASNPGAVDMEMIIVAAGD